MTNRGRERAVPPAVEIIQPARPILAGWQESIDPGQSLKRILSLHSPLVSGRSHWHVRSLGRDEIPENDSDSICVQVGRCCVRITEILASPAPGEPEWLELRLDEEVEEAALGLTLDVRGQFLFLEDRLPVSAPCIALVVEDSAQMIVAYPGLDPALLWSYRGSWPRLRNGTRGGGIADTIRVRNAEGCVLEVALPGPAPAAGVSLERVEADLPEGSAVWTPCSAPDGSTPGRDPSFGYRSSGDAPLRVRPRVVIPGSSPCVIEGSVGENPAEVRLTVVDLHGRTIRCLMRDLWVMGRLVAEYRVVRPGVYFAILEIDRAGGTPQVWRAAVAVAPGEGP
jgi:hypothetical protein